MEIAGAVRDDATTKIDYRPALNALRGFAAVYVVVYHLRSFTVFDWFGNLPFVRFGYIGVDFFFVLSGLIISHVYLEKSRHADGQFWRSFIWLRISRLFPVHLLIMACLLSAALIGPLFDAEWQHINKTQISDWFSLTFLVRQWLLPDSYAWNGPAWSVSAELFAYVIIFPLVCRFGAQCRPAVGIAMILTGAILWSSLIMTVGTVNATHVAGPLIRVSAGFLAGSGLFIILNSENSLARVCKSDWDKILTLTLVLAAPIWMLAILLNAQGYQPDMLLITYLAVLTCATYRAVGPTSRLLSIRPLFWLGEISFSLYLCHKPVMRALSYLVGFADIESGVVFGLVGLAFSMLTAHVLFQYVEIPARQKLRRLYSASHDPSDLPRLAAPEAQH
jgi:peptidoglycan/LPS O-acetylase OafA/YrhL